MPQRPRAIDAAKVFNDIEDGSNRPRHRVRSPVSSCPTSRADGPIITNELTGAWDDATSGIGCFLWSFQRLRPAYCRRIVPCYCGRGNDDPERSRSNDAECGSPEFESESGPVYKLDDDEPGSCSNDAECGGPEHNSESGPAYKLDDDEPGSRSNDTEYSDPEYGSESGSASRSDEFGEHPKQMGGGTGNLGDCCCRCGLRPCCPPMRESAHGRLAVDDSGSPKRRWQCLR